MKRVLIRVVAILAALAVAVGIYGVLIEPRLVLDDRRYEAELPRLPESWAGTEVAVFSDLQVGMWFDNIGMIERIVDTVVDEDPAAALVAGDFLYSSSPSIAEQADTVVELLRPLVEAEVPTFAVLGNHDHAVGGAEELAAALEDAGIVVLQNEAAPVPPPPGVDGGALHVVGLAAAQPGLTDVEAALAEVPGDAARVVMMHNPTVFPQLPAGSAPLAVAGHTHCGQIALPGTPRWSYLGLTEEEKTVADGFAPAEYGAEGNTMFVTCGIGFSLVPVRIGAAPQVVFFELVPGG